MNFTCVPNNPVHVCMECCVSFSAMRHSAMSVLAMACRVLSIRCSCSGVLSFHPGVSMIVHGPIPLISMFLYTVSVVVPCMGDVMATCCPSKQFISDDFPALVAPNIPMCSLSDRGVFCCIVS